MADAKQTWARVKASPRWTYADPLLFLEAALAGASLYISSHGVNTFFGFVMAADMTLAATVVLSLGIPVMESAWVLTGARIKELLERAVKTTSQAERAALELEAEEAGKQRRFFFGFMLALLLVEGIAQYLQGQARFLPSVIAYFKEHGIVGAEASGIDLLTLAQDPYAGRALALIYLGSITGAVFFIIRATADRFAALRRSVALRYTKTDAEAGLTVEVAQLKDQIVAAEENAQRLERDHAEALKNLRAQHEADVRQIEAETDAGAGRLAEARQTIADLNAQLAGKVAALEGVQAQLATAERARVEAVEDAKAARLAAGGAQKDREATNGEVAQLRLQLERAAAERQRLEEAHARELERLAMAHRAEIAEEINRALANVATVDSMPDLRKERPAAAGNGTLKPDAIALYERALADGRRMTGREIAAELGVGADKVDYITQLLSRHNAGKAKNS
jgi:hypothetical protein